MKTGLLIDMDGVIYRGSQLIPGADQFIDTVKREHIPFLFLTNNSQRTQRDVAKKLERMGILVDAENIFTCAMATAQYLASRRPAGTAYVIGEGGLLEAMHRHGFSIVDQTPDFVVVGEGRTLTLDTLERAVTMILEGAKLIATNLDPNCPTKTGVRPGCGATVAYLEAVTGIKAFGVGKPSPIMMRAARKQLGLQTSQTVMIGDTMDTDILGGVQMGYRTVLTLTGTTKAADLDHYAYGPDIVVDSVADLLDTRRFLRDELPQGNQDDDTVNLAATRAAYS